MATHGQFVSNSEPTNAKLAWLRGLRIGTRLAASFVVIALLLLASNVGAFWELRAVRTQAQHLTLADQKLITVLRLHTGLLAFREKLEALASAGDLQKFTSEALQLQASLLADVQSAKKTLSDGSPGNGRDPTLLPTLDAIESAVPSQVQVLIKLAAAGDWQAVQLRSSSQVKALALLTTSLIQKVDSEVTTEQAFALYNIRRVEERVLILLSATALVTLLIASALGFAVTRSITQPLFQLAENAKALARGEFEHYPGRGRDELAELSTVFHQTGRQLQSLYDDLRSSEAEFRTVFDSAAIGMTLVDANGRLIRVNPALLNLLQYSKQELEQANLLSITHPDDVGVSSALFQELVEGKRPGYRLRQRYIRKNGEICWIRLTTSAMRRADGQLQYCVSMIEDITPQEKAREELRQLSTRMLRVQEEEQRRIAREVHDSTSQEMTALALHLGALKKTEGNLSVKGTKLIGKCLHLAQQVSREIRTFSYLLHPPMLDEFGVWAALRLFVREFQNRSGIRATIEIEEVLEDRRLSPAQEIAIFRFVQEAFANIYRHSGSKVASVNVHTEGGEIHIEVADKGRGIPEKILKEINPFSGRLGSVGIPGMRERIMQVGGTLSIHSGKGGTTLRAIFPRDPDQEEL